MIRVRVEAEARMRFVQAWLEDLRKRSAIENLMGAASTS